MVITNVPPIFQLFFFTLSKFRVNCLPKFYHMKRFLLLSFLLLFTFLNAQVPTYVNSNGLVGWWPFNGNANDESGNGNHGTVSGATLTTDRFGSIDKAYSFDGINDYINGFINNSNLNDCTYSVWVNTPNTVGGTFIHLGTDNGSPFCNGISFGNFSAPNTNLVGHYSCVGFFNSDVSFTPDHWDLCTLVKQNNILKFFVNGNLSSQIATSGFNNPDNNFWFGSTSVNYVALFYGSLDDIGIWNRALTEQEILALYQGCQQSITVQPTNQSVNLSGVNASFNVSTNATNPIYQWQTNLGVGFQNLSNVGQYSGVNTVNLSVSNVTLTNDNQAFRCIISNGGCIDTSDIATLSILNDASISTNKETSIVLSPNPISNDFSISGIEQIVSLTLMDMNGKIVKSLNEKEKSHDVSNLNPGMYFLEVRDENQSYMIKVMKD